MAKINCIIVDDERLARLELRQMLAAHPEIHILAEAGNTADAITLVERLKPDLLFLDIQMPKWSGFDLLEQLTWTPDVIFTTAYNEYALKAFEVNALDYLMKPINKERLASSIQKIKKDIFKINTQTISSSNSIPIPYSRHKQIFIKDGENCYFIHIIDIEHFSNYGNYVRVFFNHTSALIKKSLNSLEVKLDPEYFFRCNRAEIINLRMINEVEVMSKGKLRITMESGKAVELSERKSVIFKERMAL